jgi:mediator of RNA polymerase II transcription subunit 16
MGRKLAWSNTGSMARISEDGRKITFHTLIKDPKTGAWTLPEQSPYPIHALESVKFVHLQFSTAGQDLAVVDAVGLVHFYVCVTGLGRMNEVASEIGRDRRSRNDLDAVVGLHWLLQWPIDFRVRFSRVAML